MSDQPPRAADPARVSALLLIGLLAVSLVAALAVYQARTPDLALEVVEIEENFVRSDQNPSARIVFFTRFGEPAARISIVGRGRRQVAVLAEDFELADEQRVRCEWGGDDGENAAPPGPYRLRVEAPVEDRDMVFPTKIRLSEAGGPPGSTKISLGPGGCEAAG